ncbi:unnamed protein product [Moneuplotes crassus]|uniref:Uncharacterized protein n=2 Tax=Euplotes crassus TaxID=5936 RepID=A0AAD1U945_EUPCR|nr:unnamed protein product [Moneuplotes crassus]
MIQKDTRENTKQDGGGSPRQPLDILKDFKQRSWIQNWTYTWVLRTINFAQNNELKIEDIGELSIENTTKYHASNYDTSKIGLTTSQDSDRSHPDGTLIKVLLKAYRWPLVFIFVMKMCALVLENINLHFLGYILSYIEGENDEQNRAIFCVCIMALFEFLSRGVRANSDKMQMNYSNRMKASASSLVYSKMFKISSATNKHYQKGKVQNIINQDCGNIIEFIWALPYILSVPFATLINFYSLYIYIGKVIWAPLIILAASMVLCYYMLAIHTYYKKKRKGKDDRRSTILNEIIDSITVIKTNCLIQCFQEKLGTLRKKQHWNEITSKLMKMPEHFAQAFTPYLMIMSVLYICVFKSSLTLTVPVAMAIWRLIRKIKQNTAWIPHYGSLYTDCKLSLKRVEGFLLNPEIESHLIERLDSTQTNLAIKIKKSNFFWGFEHNDSDEENDDRIYTLKDQITLKDIELNIKQNEFVAIIGDVGSGKSSLISTLLQETLYIDYSTLEKYKDVQINSKKQKKPKFFQNLKNDGTSDTIDQIMNERHKNSKVSEPVISVCGSISFVEQRPFILSKTIRENILFGEELDEKRYNKIVKACQLGRDLEILEAGDLTQIGEKGVNLSGGQKARLGIARAVYANRDIILMDDPLSALDAHVKKAIFDEVCCGELKNTTRVLVTHAVDFLDRVDRIIVINKGRVILNGSYKQLENEEYFKKVMSTIYKQEIKSTKEESKDFDKEDEQQNYLSKKEKKLLDEDINQNTEITTETFLNYFMYLKQGLIFIIAGILIRSFIRMVNIKADYEMLTWVKEFSKSEQASMTGLYYVLLYVLLIISSDLIIWIIDIVQNFLIDKKMFDAMINRLLHAPINLFFDKASSGIINQRFSGNLREATKQLPNMLKRNIKDFIEMCITLFFVIYSAPICGLIVPCAGIFYSFLLKGYTPANTQVNKIKSSVNSPAHTHFSESIEGITTIRAFNKIHEFEDKRFMMCDQIYGILLVKRGLNGWLSTRINLISITFVFFLYMYCILYRDNQDPIIIGLLMGYIMELQWILNRFVRQAISIHSLMTSFDRCKKLTEIPQEAAQSLPVPQDTEGNPWITHGNIKFTNFSLRYRPDTEIVLKNISIDIQAGHKVGVVGRTGAGKSTLCLALCRIVEALEGSIYIDGVDISTVGLADLRDRITIIPQEPVLFRNILRFNLDPEQKCSDEELISLLHKAKLGSLLTRDGSGLNFTIADKGSNLSAGEKALICICRAVLRHNKIVIMDEATASIDVNTEEIIQKLMKEEFADSTVITVAHRLNTVMNSDKIIVMDFGEIIEYDTPQNLLKNESSLFSSMMNKFNS